MKYSIRCVLVLLLAVLAACDSQSPSQITASRTAPDSGSVNKPVMDQQREAWISNVFEVGEVSPVSATGAARPFSVTAQAHQYADARLTLRLNGVVHPQPEEDIVGTYWRQVGGASASILSPAEAQTEVILPDVNVRQTLQFEFVGLNSAGLYDFDSVVVTVLPLPAKLSVDLVGIESGEASVVLQLDALAGDPVTYFYRTLDGTALAGQDFQYQEGTVTFDAASLTQSIPLEVLEDNLTEEKIFYLEVSVAGEPESTATYAVTIGGDAVGNSKGDFCSVNDSEANAQWVTGFSVLMVDVLGQALPETAVEVARAGEQGESHSELYYTDSLGSFVVPCLPVGLYDLALAVGEGSEVISLKVVPESQDSLALVSFPVRRLESGELQRPGENGVIVALSGMVSDSDGVPLAGAQVEISAGAQTNGAIAAATTDENGAYTLLLNVGGAVAPFLSGSQIRVVANGYRTFALQDQDLLQVQAWSGLNFVLQELMADSEVYYSESFDNAPQEGYCGAWRSALDILNPDTESGASLWHLHEGGLAIQNRAYLEELVTLAPDDESEGYIPDPVSGSSCWYGDHKPGAFTQGNYLGSFYEDAESEAPTGVFDGGTSLSYNKGALISPWIDLTTVQPPLSLSFLTWWEIESVNPNGNGYDLIFVEVKEEGQSAWTTLARFNPTSDPVGNDDLVHIPFSNRGFNRAPAWLAQEPISLDGYAGKRIQIQFVFNTVDAKFNGFRGWLVDEIKITSDPGTFPLWNAE